LTNDVVLRLAKEESLRQACLTVEHGSHRQQILGDLALDLVRLARVTNPQITANVTDISHGSIYPSDMELVLETDGQAMEWADGLPVGGEKVIEKSGVLNGLLEKNLM